MLNWRDPRHSLAGGAELYAWEFARALVRAGARVDFVTARETGQVGYEVVDGIHVVRRGGQLSFYVHALLWLLLRRRRIDAVLDADCGIPVFSPLVLSRRRTAVVLLVHHVHLDQFGTYFGPLMARVGRMLEGRVMPRLYRGLTTIAVSRSTEREMVERLAWHGPIRILHNGNTRSTGAARPRATGDRVVVLGRLAPHKRVGDVVRAVGLLKTIRPEIHLDVIGKGPDLEALRDLVCSSGLENHVTLHGFLDEAAKRTRVASGVLHVSGSDVEGWGQVVIEAASLGLPTLARDVPGMRDSIRAGETGWLLEESGSCTPLPARLAEGIDSALRELSDSRRQAVIAAACERWASEFSWDEMHQGAVRLMEMALDEIRCRATTEEARE